MHIVHLLLTSRFAGSERYAVELAAAQAAAGHEVTVLLRAAGTRDRPDAIAHRLPQSVRRVVVPDWLAPWHARRALRRLRPDVAHAHLSGGCRALRGLGGKMLRLATLHIRYKSQQHAHLDGLVAIAPWQLEAVPAALRAATVQIDNWTLAAPAAPGARASVRAGHGIAADAFVFGSLGRVEHSKGHDVLVEAFARASIPGARLVIVGGGRAFEEVRGRAGDGVLMPGFSDRPRDWYAAFDCFVSAARSEPFGLVFLEAMEARLPILATASEGARHLAARIGTPLVPVADVGALAAALAELARSRPERRAYDMDGYRLDSKLPAFEAFYRDAAARCGISLPGAVPAR